jgi:hypothetical protein
LAKAGGPGRKSEERRAEAMLRNRARIDSTSSDAAKQGESAG